jgi:pantoate--beta-alanine ligase
MRQIARQARNRGLRLGFVPTMGGLHEGHLSLVRLAKEQADVVIASVFVNPAQFNEESDYERYPRSLMRDADLLIAEGVDYLFAPEPAEMYPEGFDSWVEVERLSRKLEGASRPGHFRGVATVVLKLLQVLQPHFAVFGEKDAQQLAVIRRMARDLMLDTEILSGPTVRDEQDGVALSSRNALLDDPGREAAAAIPRALRAAGEALAGGERAADPLLEACRQVLAAEERLELDYLALVDPESFDPLESVSRPALLVLAARVGDVRLIDNQRLEPPAE